MGEKINKKLEKKNWPKKPSRKWVLVITDDFIGNGFLLLEKLPMISVVITNTPLIMKFQPFLDSHK